MAVMSRIRYTYVVDHGYDRPAVSVNTVVNGGALVAVSFQDELQKLELYDEFLMKLRDESKDGQVRAAIDDFLN